ncbi:unnamed protein product [Clavelina lepadiformis]|uniref:Uncharacterized protein n=1 Tax=Clavelina lepadiformis TaxID=159417 RepID=A0ABP0GCM2_CLALP
MKFCFAFNQVVLISGGILLTVCATVGYGNLFVRKKKPSRDLTKIGLLPDVVVDIKEGEENYDSDDENGAPFVPKKTPRWWHVFTKYFEKTKPPIDKTMLALHISAMSYIRKTPINKIPTGHVPVILQEHLVSTKTKK